MKKAAAWSTCVIQAIRLEVGMGTGKQPVVVRARIGGRWWKVITMTPLELIVGAQSEITAAGIKSRVRQGYGRGK